MRFAAFTIVAIATATAIATGAVAGLLPAANAATANETPPPLTMEFRQAASADASGMIKAKTGKNATPKQRGPLGEMSQTQIRKELIGPPMKGSYADGKPWDETYFQDGSIVYRDDLNNWHGDWSFRGTGFCTFYNDGVNGGCWSILKTSANCYEFHPSKRAGKLNSQKPNQSRNWTAQGWRTTDGSTCDVGVGV